jgi:molybdenum cofactor cytidylyltransferase
MSRIAAVILAAGASSRFGQPKQLICYRGRTLLELAIDASRSCAPQLVVLGRDDSQITDQTEKSGAIPLANPDWSRGIGTSIRAGVRAAIDRDPALPAILLMVCDQPFVSATVIEELIAHWKSSSRPIAASRYAGTLGVPAVFDRACFPLLLQLPDEAGAKSIILAEPERVAEFVFAEGAIDIDTPQDWDRVASLPSLGK